MQILAPDILAEAKGLSHSVTAATLVLGLALWLFGGRHYRFWLVLTWTVGMGLVGLQSGAAYGVQPLVAALLAALAAGALALALARLVAFAAIGTAAWLTMRALAPAFDEPFICFLIGGMLGLVFYRFWMTVLTSAAGTVLFAYALLLLLDGLGRTDAVAWAERYESLANWGCAGATVVGVGVQFLLERRGVKAKGRERGGRRSDKGSDKDGRQPRLSRSRAA